MTAYSRKVDGAFSLKDGEDEKDTSTRANYGRILRSLSEKAMPWERLRVLFLGKKDSGSEFSELPIELIYKIFQEITPYFGTK